MRCLRHPSQEALALKAASSLPIGNGAQGMLPSAVIFQGRQALWQDLKI